MTRRGLAAVRRGRFASHGRFQRPAAYTSPETPVPPAFTRGTVLLTVHAQDAAAGVPRLDRIVELPDRATAVQPRVWTLATEALGPGPFVLRLTLQDDRGRGAQTAVLFEVGR